MILERKARTCRVREALSLIQSFKWGGKYKFAEFHTTPISKCGCREIKRKMRKNRGGLRESERKVKRKERERDRE